MEVKSSDLENSISTFIAERISALRIIKGPGTSSRSKGLESLASSRLQRLFGSKENNTSSKSQNQLKDYIKHLKKYGQFDSEELIRAFILFCRFFRLSNLQSSPLCYFKGFAVALFISQKFSKDVEVFFLDDFGKLSGIPAGMLEEMELGFAAAIDYKFYVSLEQCQRVVKYGMLLNQ